jgi:hypothetical protein
MDKAALVSADLENGPRGMRLGGQMIGDRFVDDAHTYRVSARYLLSVLVLA